MFGIHDRFKWLSYLQPSRLTYLSRMKRIYYNDVWNVKNACILCIFLNLKAGRVSTYIEKCFPSVWILGKHYYYVGE